MKVDIITFHSANNYGAVLQCYALTEALKNFGHEVELADLPLHGKPNSLRSSLRNWVMGRGFVNFKKQHLPPISDASVVKDAYVFGSDQIWNLQITKSNYASFFGDWVDKSSRKIAYAASFGVSSWDFPEYTESVGELLKSFDALGVRESTAVDICAEQFGIDSEQVLDPTLLLNDYSRLFKKRKKAKSLVCYIFGKEPETIESIRLLGNKNQLLPVLLNDFRIRKDIKSVPFPSVETWLSYLESSDMVVTDSFHCMVFSILFRKNFIAIPAHPDRIGRMTSLLNALGLESRFFNSIEEALESDVASLDIDYVSVENKLKILRTASLDFLEKSLVIN